MVAVTAATATAAAMLLLAGFTALRAGRPRPVRAVARRSRLLDLLPDRFVRPWTVAGFAFAADRGAGGSGRSARSAGVGALVGLTGVVAAVTFGAGLHALGEDPARWGWYGDVAVIDVTPELVRELRADPMVAEVTTYARSTVSLGDGEVPAVTINHRGGGRGWRMFEGRLPAVADEVALGAATARRYALQVGDHVGVTGGDGDRVVLRVVGTGLGPTSESATFAREVALTRATFDALRHTEPFTTAQVAATPGVTAAQLRAHLGARLEVSGAEAPISVATLLGLSRLPGLLTGFLAVVAAAASVHGVATTGRRRRRDLAILRALGATAPQSRRSLRTSSLVTTATTVGVALPLGIGIGRVVWWLVSHDAGLDTGLVVPWWWLALVPPLGVAVAVAAARLATTGGERESVGARLRAGEA